MLTSQRRFITHRSMRSDLWGSRMGHFVDLFSHFEFYGVFVWTELNSRTLLVRTDIFSYTDKKGCVFEKKISGYVWTGPYAWRSTNLRKELFTRSAHHFALDLDVKNEIHSRK